MTRRLVILREDEPPAGLSQVLEFESGSELGSSQITLNPFAFGGVDGSLLSVNLMA